MSADTVKPLNAVVDSENSAAAPSDTAASIDTSVGESVNTPVDASADVSACNAGGTPATALHGPSVVSGGPSQEAFLASDHEDFPYIEQRYVPRPPTAVPSTSASGPAVFTSAPSSSVYDDSVTPPPAPTGDSAGAGAAPALDGSTGGALPDTSSPAHLPADAAGGGDGGNDGGDIEDDEEAAPEGRPDDKPMGIMGHLSELRSRLVRCCIAVGIAFMGCYTVSDYLFTELCKPLVAALPEGSKLIFTALPEAFFVYLQVGIVAAIFVASPYIFYQIWAFIAPGLYEEEKRFVVPIALCSAVLFLMGAAFCYWIVFPFAFTFFVGFANESIAAMPSLQEYLGFALKLLVAFGLICEMPLFTLFLARMGLVSAKAMRRVRRYAILVIFIAAAILTPPDVISQLLMACPMIILYEVSIFIAVMFGKKATLASEEEKDEHKGDAS